MIADIADALLPVFFVMALGFLAGKRRTIDNLNVGSINSLVMTFAIPVALFTTLAGTKRAVIGENASLGVVVAASMIAVYVVVYAVRRSLYALSSGDAAVEALTVAFPNCAAVGFPLVGAVFGASAHVGVAVALAIGAVTLSPVTLALLDSHRARRQGATGGAGRGMLKALGASVRKPIVLGPVLGLAWSLGGLPVAQALQTTLLEIGAVGSGVALFLTGLVLSAQQLRITKPVILATLVALLVQPLIGAAIAVLVHVPVAYAHVAILILAIPGGFFGVLFGIPYNARSQVASSTLMLSSIGSIVTIPTAILLLHAT
jgi:malonate transporter and related proteins